MRFAMTFFNMHFTPAFHDGLLQSLADAMVKTPANRRAAERPDSAREIRRHQYRSMYGFSEFFPCIAARTTLSACGRKR